VDINAALVSGIDEINRYGIDVGLLVDFLIPVEKQL
jgi:hypothetical protein